MLRNALDDYLSALKERDLYLPIRLLLSAMGFCDIHLTHGQFEFGKDLIAKKAINGEDIQYTFQVKVGDIGATEWRKDVQGQMLQAITSTLTHGNFDPSLPHQVVLVTTGDFIGSVGPAFSNYNDELEKRLGTRRVEFWSKSNLIDRFMEFGLGPLLHVTAKGFIDYGQFLFHYGKVLQDDLPVSALEPYSRTWLDEGRDLKSRLLLAGLEGEVLSSAYTGNGRLYEAAYVTEAILRVFSAAPYLAEDASDLKESFDAATAALHNRALAFVQEFRRDWEPDRNFVRLPSIDMVTYLVQSERVIEMSSIAYFTTDDAAIREDLGQFLDSFIKAEPGAAHPLSDRYAVSIVLATLALIDSGRKETAADLLRRATFWLCDRTQQGLGLASLSASEIDEIVYFLSPGLGKVRLRGSASSFLGTALADLAAYVGDPVLYSDIVNDLKACDIHPQYVQPQDTIGVVSIEARDVIRYPSVEFNDELGEAGSYAYADHLMAEKDAFRCVEALGPVAILELIALLRDRYFPKLWPSLVNRPNVA